MSETLMVVRTPEELERVCSYLSDPEFVYAAYDSETTGLKKDSEIIGYSIAVEEGIGIYVVLAEWFANVRTEDCQACCGVGSIDKGLTKAGKPRVRPKCKECKASGKITISDGELVHYPEMRAASAQVFNTLTTKRLIMHNSPFDCQVTERELGFNLRPHLHTDTMELWHVLDENENAALKDLGARLFGEDALTEKEAMKASVITNGGIWSDAPGGTKEMYKADSELLGRYGAKDTILTLKLFYEGIPRLFDENLDKFFYEEESMPLMRTATYDMNTVGLKVDLTRLAQVERELTDECMRLRAEIHEMLAPLTKEKYPKGFGDKAEEFNIGSTQQMAWLLFDRMGEMFLTLTDGGKALCKQLGCKPTYSNKAKRDFISSALDYGKNPYKFMQCDVVVLEEYAPKYEWCAKLLEYRSAGKILGTYVLGIKERLHYGIIYPGFLQHGTTSGRYSSRNPNFQNLPRDDKRIKSCIISRPGRVFVGADYSQLEPRVFASVSQDPDLMECFASGKDFYSVVGAPIFDKEHCSLFKKDENSFAKLYEDLRNISKAFALATPYGTSAFQQAQKLKLPQKRCEEIMEKYLTRYASVHQMMLESHEMVKDHGVVYSLYGRPRRIPAGLEIRSVYGDLPHGELPYAIRNLLNLGMNHRVQSSAASIVNRAAIRFCRRMEELGLDAKLLLQVHDELIAECREEDKEIVRQELKDAMENTTLLPGVLLQADPKIAYNLADLK